MLAAVTTKAGSIEIAERARPLAGEGEVLVRVAAVGLCGSDLHFFDGTDPYASYPRVQGHEFSGTVVDVGSAQGAGARVGDLVTVEPLIACGVCYPCRRGRSNCCMSLRVLGVQVDGALAEYVSVRRDAAYVASGLAPELAALVEPLSIGVHACRRASVAANERIVIFGAGAIGQAVLISAVGRGADVLVVDRVASRLELARQLGAAEVVDATNADVSAMLHEWTGGDGTDVAVEATGAAPVLRQCIDAAAHGARVLVLGTPSEDVELPVLEVTRKELTILGSRNNVGCFPEALDIARAMPEQVGKLITQRFELAELEHALRFASAHPEQAEKVMISVS